MQRLVGGVARGRQQVERGVDLCHTWCTRSAVHLVEGARCGSAPCAVLVRTVAGVRCSQPGADGPRQPTPWSQPLPITSNSTRLLGVPPVLGQHENWDMPWAVANVRLGELSSATGANGDQSTTPVCSHTGWNGPGTPRPVTGGLGPVPHMVHGLSSAPSARRTVWECTMCGPTSDQS